MNCKRCKYYREYKNKTGVGFCTCQEFIEKFSLLTAAPIPGTSKIEKQFRILGIFAITKDKALNPCHFEFYDDIMELF